MHKKAYTIFIFLTLSGVNVTVSANSEPKISRALEAATTAYEN